MHANRKLMHKGLAVGACHVDGHHLAFGEGFQRRIQRLRDAKAAREEVHRAGGQYGQGFLLVHEKGRRRRNRAVAASRDHDVDIALCCGPFQSSGDFAAGNDVDLNRVASRFQRLAQTIGKG